MPCRVALHWAESICQYILKLVQAWCRPSMQYIDQASNCPGHKPALNTHIEDRVACCSISSQVSRGHCLLRRCKKCVSAIVKVVFNNGNIK